MTWTNALSKSASAPLSNSNNSSMNFIAKTKRIADAISFNLRVHHFPDRKYLRQTMLPAIAATSPRNVLLAGTRRYTSRYPSAFDSAATSVWTIDFDPDVARWGNGDLHRTCDIREVHHEFPDIRFDVIHLNGLIGFGVDSAEEIEQMADACHRALAPEGFLMIGWDDDVTEDPAENHSITDRMTHAAYHTLPKRHSVVGYTGHSHIFDWFQKK